MQKKRILLQNSVPLCYRLIVLGFVKKMSPAELNEKLTEQGSPRLYSRNFWEATLIYAFLNGLSYENYFDACRLDNISGVSQQRESILFFSGREE